MTSPTRAAAMGLAAMLASGAACVDRPPLDLPQRPETSASPAPDTFVEDGRLVMLAANAFAARMADAGELLPLEVAVANRRLDRLTVAAEHFRLRLPDGTVLPVAPPRASVGRSLELEFRAGTATVPFAEAIRARVTGYRFVPAGALRAGDSTLTETVELGRDTWTRFHLWFGTDPAALRRDTAELIYAPPEIDGELVLILGF